MDRMHAAPGTAEYGAVAILLAWEVGALLWLAGMLRLGVLANFLSHSVIDWLSSHRADRLCGLSRKHLGRDSADRARRSS